MSQNEKSCVNCNVDEQHIEICNSCENHSRWQPIQPEPAKEPASGCDIVHCKYRDTIKQICTVDGDCIYRSCEIYPYEQEIADLRRQLADEKIDHEESEKIYKAEIKHRDKELAACQKELAEYKTAVESGNLVQKDVYDRLHLDFVSRGVELAEAKAEIERLTVTNSAILQHEYNVGFTDGIKSVEE